LGWGGDIKRRPYSAFRASEDEGGVGVSLMKLLVAQQKIGGKR